MLVSLGFLSKNAVELTIDVNIRLDMSDSEFNPGKRLVLIKLLAVTHR